MAIALMYDGTDLAEEGKIITVAYWIDTYEDLEEVLQQHGGRTDDEVKLLPEGRDTPETFIGIITCHDGKRIRLEANTFEQAQQIYERLF